MPTPRLSQAITAAVAALFSVFFLMPPGASGHSLGRLLDPAVRTSVELVENWRFIRDDVPDAARPEFDDSAWALVRVPHTWNATDGLDGVPGYYRGVGWYRIRVDVPVAPAGYLSYLEFDGANTVAEIFVDGVSVGRHEGGYARFRVPLTGAAPGARATVAVRVSNAEGLDIAPLSDDWTQFGGIYRGVRLLTVSPLHIDLLDDGGPGVYLRAIDLGGAAKVSVRSRLRNVGPGHRDLRAAVVIRDAAGRRVAGTISRTLRVAGRSTAVLDQRLEVAAPHRWQGRRDPYLYQVTVVIIDAKTLRPVDSVSQPLGIRTVAVDPQRGFLLNGTPYRLYGVNLHQGRATVGAATTRADLDADLDLVREIGATSVRLVHYPHAPYVYERADRDGLVLWTEIPFMHKASETAHFATNARLQLRELMKQNANHPSVAFWGIGNEPTFKPGPDPNPLLAQLAEDVRAADDTRIDSYATCCVADDDVSVSHTTATGYHRYEGWYFATSDLFGPWADANHAAQPGKAFAVTEYGAGGNIGVHAENPTPSYTPFLDAHTEEYQAIVHEDHWRQIVSRPYLFASWAFMLTDVSSDGRSEGDAPGVNDKGLVTMDRSVRKDAFYFYKANWNPEPMIHITSRRFAERTDLVTDVKVYANTGALTLVVNGVRVGTAQPDPFRTVVWPDVDLRVGQNIVTVTSDENMAIHDTVTWNAVVE